MAGMDGGMDEDGGGSRSDTGTGAEPGSAPRQDLRRTLLEHAIALARHGGPGAVVIRDVQRRAGVSHNAAYRHYADRDALIAAVALAALSMLATTMREARDGRPVSPVCERLRALAHGYVEFAQTEPGLFATIGLARDPGMDAGPHTDETSPIRLLADCLDDMLASGEMDPARRDHAEIVTWSAVHGFATLLLHGPLAALDAATARAALERVLDVVVDGISPHSGR